jgi:hypothetical protein
MAQPYTIDDFNSNLLWNRPEQGYFEVDVGFDSPTDADFAG